MRIVLTRSHNLFNIGGINTYVWNIACELDRRGYDVHVISGCGNISVLDKHWLEKFNGKIHVLKEANFTSQYEQFSKWIINGSRLLRRLKPDVVHFNGMVPFVFNRAPSVATCHGILNKNMNASYILYDKISYAHFVDAIIAVSEKVKNELTEGLNVNPDKIRIIPCGFDMSAFNCLPFEERENSLVCGWGHIKNPETSLKIFHELKKDHLPCKLYVAGLSREQALSVMPELEQLSQDKEIIFTGKLDRHEIAELFKKVKCGLIPSVYESFSYGTLELLASGTPVVGSSTIPENVLRHGCWGFTASPEDFVSMTKYVLNLFLDEPLWKEMSQNAMQHANLFSIREVTDTLIDVYQSLCR